MENLLTVKEEQMLFKHALVCDIELTNGKQTKAIIAFNSKELDFEEINAGINSALGQCRNVRKTQNTLCGLKTGMFVPVVYFQDTVY